MKPRGKVTDSSVLVFVLVVMTSGAIELSYAQTGGSAQTSGRPLSADRVQEDKEPVPAPKGLVQPADRYLDRKLDVPASVFFGPEGLRFDPEREIEATKSLDDASKRKPRTLVKPQRTPEPLPGVRTPIAQEKGASLQQLDGAWRTTRERKP